MHKEICPKNVAKYKQGIIVGRFQPFHLEHLRFVIAAAKKVDHLWVGITRPFGNHLPEIGGARATDDANPLPYWLRFKCVESTLIHDAKIPQDTFSILPAPLVPGIIEQLVPKGTIFLTTFVEEWSLFKEKLFINAGFKVIKLDLGNKKISGTMIRERIRKKDESWKDFIPRSIREQYATLIAAYVRNVK